MAGFRSAEHAVLIGLDGLPVSALHAALANGHAPNLQALRARGAYTDDARVTQPSISLPNWASTLFSVPPTFHGVHTSRLDGDVRPATLTKSGTWPNAFTVARRAKGPGFGTAAYYSWPPLSQLLPQATLNASVLAPCASCDACLRVEPKLVADFAAALRQRRFGLSWLYIDTLDECGHARGAHSPGYAELVRTVDGWVGVVVDALRASGMLDRTALLVMSDHGREKTGRDHGGFTTAELAVQWLLTGPAVRKGVRLSSPISIMDTMPTLLHAVGVPPPVQFYGRPVREAYERLSALQPAGTHGRSPPLWSVEQNVTAAQMLATVRDDPRAEARRKRPATLSSSWDSVSFTAGGATGVAAVACVLLAAQLVRTRREASGRLTSRSLSGRFLSGAPMHAHPVVNRLRAAAGTCSPDEEEFSPLVG